MTTQWPKVSLGELLRLERRPVNVRPSEKYQEIGIYCFGRGVFHKQSRTGLDVGEKDLFLLKEGDFILQVTFAWEGAVAIISSAEDGMYGSTRYPTFRVDENRCVPKFLLNYFRTADGLAQLVRICPGSAGRNRVLSIKRIPEVMVPLPSLAEQLQIVSRIDELAANIVEAQSLRIQAMDEAKLLRMVLGARTFDRLTRDYPVRPLADVVSIRGGGTPSKSDPSYWRGSVPWITPKDMKRRELSDAIDHISELATQKTAAKLIAPNAVLVVVRGMILVHTFPAAILRAPAAINQDMKALIPSKELLPEYLCTAFWAHNSKFLALVERSGHDTRKLETDKLLSSMIAVPPLSEQRRIIAELGALEVEGQSLKRLQTETAIELDALLPSVLSKAFSGGL